MNKLFFLLLTISTQSFALQIREVPIPNSIAIAVDEAYNHTRQNADCCGISSIQVFEVIGQGHRTEILRELLTQKIEEFEVTHRCEDFEISDLNHCVAKLLKMSKTSGRHLLTAVKNIAGHFLNDESTDSKKALQQLKFIGSYLRSKTQSTDLEYAIEDAPYPNVDGYMVIRLSEDLKHILVLRYNEGA